MWGTRTELKEVAGIGELEWGRHWAAIQMWHPNPERGFPQEPLLIPLIQ